MTQIRSISSYLCELIAAYQALTKKNCTEMALDFGITLSNLYLYRTGFGNPRAKTIDKIIRAVAENCPETFEKAGWDRLPYKAGVEERQEEANAAV